MTRVRQTANYTMQLFNLFKQKGMELSMDSIAFELGITKKTLYNNFGCKEEMFSAVATHFYDSIEQKIKQEFTAERRPLAQMLLMAEIVSSEIRKLGRKFLTDISKRGGVASLLNLTDRAGFYSTLIRQNLRQGIKEGLYRGNIKIEAVTFFYTSVIETFYRWDGECSSLFEYEDYFLEHVKYHLYSITNLNGRQELESLLRKQKPVFIGN